MHGRTGRLFPLLGLLAAIVAAFALAACGNSEDVTITQTGTEAETSEDDQVAELEEQVEELQEEADDEDATSTTTSTTDEAPPPDDSGSTGGVPAGSESCGDGVYVEGSTTSCAFGRNVAADYYSSPGNTFESFSPTTGQSYEMTCTGPPPIVCTGGNNATVYLTHA